MGHERYQQRLALVDEILSKFNLRATETIPIDYDEKCPFPYNNFLYKVTLEAAFTEETFRNVKSPFTVSAKVGGGKHLVVRISNPKAGGLEQGNRVENEVGAIYLAREGLRVQKPELIGLVPCVYAWEAASAAKDNLGWILMDFKEGVQLDAHFKSLDDEQKRAILEQMADVFSGIQKAPIPVQLGQLSGITINAGGELIAGSMTTMEGGPWPSLVEFWRNKFSARLEDADESSVIGGWEKNNTRERVEKFLANGLESVVAPSENLPRVLVHGDFTMNNILVDPAANKLTGVVDFDFASVSHPSQEFFTSFGDIGGNTGGWQGPDHHAGRLEKAIVAGSFGDASDDDKMTDEARSEWRIARTWDTALAARGVMRPSEVPGIPLLSRLPQLEGLLCPFRLVHPRLVQNMSPEELEEARSGAEEVLGECLAEFGY